MDNKDITNINEQEEVNTKVKKAKVKKTKKNNLTTFLMAIGFAFCFAALATLIVIGAIASGVSNNQKASTKLVSAGTINYGSSAVVTLEQPHLSKYDDKVLWYVDDNLVTDGISEDYELTFTPKTPGLHTVRTVIIGKTTREYYHEFNVEKPILTIKYEDCQYTYGDAPECAAYSVYGLVDGDTAESIDLDVKYKSKRFDRVGRYYVDGTAQSLSDKYDIRYISGTVQVAPRKLIIKYMPIEKEYDGTTSIDSTVELDGVIEGDNLEFIYDLSASCKDVGECDVVINSAKLVGGSSSNYIIEETSAPVRIHPKKVHVHSIIANDKMYDGNNTVTFSQIGILDGVSENDVVAIGLLSGHFDTAKVGKDKLVYIDDIQLVGKDADNYCLVGGLTATAEIKHNGVVGRYDDDSIQASPH